MGSAASKECPVQNPHHLKTQNKKCDPSKGHLNTSLWEERGSLNNYETHANVTQDTRESRSGNISTPSRRNFGKDTVLENELKNTGCGTVQNDGHLAFGNQNGASFENCTKETRNMSPAVQNTIMFQDPSDNFCTQSGIDMDTSNDGEQKNIFVMENDKLCSMNVDTCDDNFINKKINDGSEIHGLHCTDGAQNATTDTQSQIEGSFLSNLSDKATNRNEKQIGNLSYVGDLRLNSLTVTSESLPNMPCVTTSPDHFNITYRNVADVDDKNEPHIHGPKQRHANLKESIRENETKSTIDVCTTDNITQSNAESSLSPEALSITDIEWTSLDADNITTSNSESGPEETLSVTDSDLTRLGAVNITASNAESSPEEDSSISDSELTRHVQEMQIPTNTTINTSASKTSGNSHKPVISERSSASCLDKLDAAWEAFFSSNVSLVHADEDIPHSFQSANANNVPPSSTEYRRKRRGILTRGYTDVSIATTNEEFDETSLYDARSINQGETAFGDEREKITIEKNGLKPVKQINYPLAKLDKPSITEQDKTNVANFGKSALSGQSKINSRNKHRDYNFDIAFGYLEDLQVTIQRHGFFKHIPTFEILKKAQNVLKKVKTIPPRNEYGVIIPYPYLDLESETRDFETEAKNVYQKLNISKYSTIPELTRDLQDVIFPHMNTDIQKVRAVYIFVLPSFVECWKYWQNNQDISRVGDTEIYKDVVNSFMYICREAGLHCSEIKGLQKDCHCGDPEPSKWAAVVLESKWRLISPNVPFCFCLEKNVMHEQILLKHQLKEYYKEIYSFLIDFYFLADPCHFIYTNIPEKLYWQLLCRHISRDEWENSVQILPFFFFHNLHFLNFSGQNLKLQTESCTISVQYPEEKKLLFSAIIFDVDNRSEMNASTFIENNDENHSVDIHCRVRRTGVYTLKLYCREVSFPFYVCVCNLQIHFTLQISDDIVLYQPGLRRHWGPGHDTTMAGLIPISHKNATIDIDDEFVLIQFKLKCNLGLFFSLLDNQGQAFEKNILYWISDRTVFINVTSPGKGSYRFYIFSSDGKNFSNSIPSCSYLLNFKSSPCERFQNFQIPNRKLGITEYGRRQQCLLLSENTDFIYASDRGILQLNLKVADCSKCYPKLQFHGSFKPVSMQEHCSWFSNEDKVSCTINLPKHGDYLFTLASKSDHGDMHLYFVIIQVAIPSEVWAPFPKKLLHHTEVTVRVIEPHAGIIPAKTDIYFKLELICDCDVAIVTSKGWFHLNETTTNCWEGNVTTGVKGTDVTVVARFEVGSEKFTSLLVYKVVTAEDIQRKSEYQQTYRDEALLRYKRIRNGNNTS